MLPFSIVVLLGFGPVKDMGCDFSKDEQTEEARSSVAERTPFLADEQTRDDNTATEVYHQRPYPPPDGANFPSPLVHQLSGAVKKRPVEQGEEPPALPPRPASPPSFSAVGGPTPKPLKPPGRPAAGKAGPSGKPPARPNQPPRGRGGPAGKRAGRGKNKARPLPKKPPAATVDPQAQKELERRAKELQEREEKLRKQEEELRQQQLRLQEKPLESTIQPLSSEDEELFRLKSELANKEHELAKREEAIFKKEEAIQKINQANAEHESLKKDLEKKKKKSRIAGFLGFGEQESEATPEISIGVPYNVKHEGHVGWDPENGFDVYNIPEEWKALFSKAGVTTEQLADKETADFIVSFVATEITRNTPAVPRAKDQNVDDSSTPLPPPLPPMEPTTHDKVEKPASGANELAQALEQRKAGEQVLRKVDPNELVRGLKPDEQDNLAGALARALNKRRMALVAEQSDDEMEEESTWE